MSGDDLMVLRSVIKAGRPLIASTERESQEIGAYRSAVEKAIALTNDNLKRGEIVIDFLDADGLASQTGA